MAGFDFGGALAGGLSGFGSGGWAGAIGGALGGGLFGGGAKKPKPKFLPFNIRSGLGTVNWTKKGEGSITLAEPYAEAERMYQELGKGFLGGITPGTPMELSNQAYGLLRGMSAPEEEQSRLALENRLFKQGMLGSTGGGIRSQAFETGVGRTQLQQQLESLQLGQTLTDQQLARAMGLFTGAQGLYNPLQEQMRLGLGGQAGMGVAGMQAGMLNDSANRSRQMGLWGTLWPGLQKGAQDLFGQWGQIRYPQGSDPGYSTGV